MKKLLITSVCLAAVWGGVCDRAVAQTLEGFARLPADTFAKGPTSGNLILPANGRVPPFDGKQPVQGVSSVLPGPDGDFWVMPDNGFGAKENSPDFVLRVYRVDPHFKTKSGGPAAVQSGIAPGAVFCKYFPRLMAGVLAQLVERLVRNEKVRGSNPLGSTSLCSERSGERRLPRRSAST